MLAHVTLVAISFCLKNRMIIHHFGSICKENFYDRHEVTCGAEKLLRGGGVLCPLCGGRLAFHGTYRRRVIDDNGKRHDGWVAQAHCGACKTYPALIPDFIMPYMHYQAGVIEAVIEENEESGGIKVSGCAADNSTIWRWINRFKERGGRAVGSLLSILYAVYERHISALEIRNRGLLKQLTRLLREIPHAQTGGVIGRTNIILTRHGRGFL
jgi:hypothetical protein